MWGVSPHENKKGSELVSLETRPRGGPLSPAEPQGTGVGKKKKERGDTPQNPPGGGSSPSTPAKAKPGSAGGRSSPDGGKRGVLAQPRLPGVRLRAGSHSRAGCRSCLLAPLIQQGHPAPEFYAPFRNRAGVGKGCNPSLKGFPKGQGKGGIGRGVGGEG